jgi:iron(III) transport system substrate-binding protein
MLALASAGCGSRGPQVVVYTSVDDEFVRPVAERFQKETGIQVNLVPDTEETKSTGLVNRLIAEKARPQADVFWSGDPVRAALLKAKGVTAPYHSPQAEGLPKLYSDPEGHWTGFSARAKVLMYNKDLVKEGQEPKSVRDLLDPRFRGMACLANPLFGTTSMYAAALFQVLGDDKAKQFFEDFAANGGKVLSSNGEVKRRVAAGEFAVGLTDTDDYNEARKEGKPVGVVYPDADEIGTLIVPNCAVLIAGGPNLEHGKRFIDNLLRPETEQALAEGDAAQMPVRPGVSAPAHVVPIDKLRPMKVDYVELGRRLEELSRGYLKDWVDRNSR